MRLPVPILHQYLPPIFRLLLLLDVTPQGQQVIPLPPPLSQVTRTQHNLLHLWGILLVPLTQLHCGLSSLSVSRALTPQCVLVSFYQQPWLITMPYSWSLLGLSLGLELITLQYSDPRPIGPNRPSLHCTIQSLYIVWPMCYSCMYS